VALGLLAYKSNPAMIAISIALIGIQLFDGLIGLKISSFKTVDPLLAALRHAIVLSVFLASL
jgi:hypothetical protein